MTNLVLTRTIRTPHCTVGRISLPNTQILTLERPWVPSSECRSGTKGVSCVAAGKYRLERHSTEMHPHAFALVNPDLGVCHWPQALDPHARTTVLIHVANEVSELRGCIAVGMASQALATMDGYRVLSSKVAFELLMAALPWDDDNTLEIVEQI